MIMDIYKKKYDEALEKARVWKEKSGMPADKQSILDDIFPELAEPEDEKIRKELIEHVKDQQSSFISAPDCRDKYEEEENNKYNSWLVWLEKQGEKKPIEEVNGEDYGIDGLWHAQRILENTLGSVDGYQTDDGILDHKAAITAVKKLYKQKPTETVKWSAQEEYCICELEAMVKEVWRKAENVRNDITIKKMQELMFFLKTLNPNKKSQRIISAEAKEALYDKLAWSEEDESLRLRTIGALETCKIGSPTKCVDEQINWLKSLKDRYTWKPSKEQKPAWSEEDEKMIGRIRSIIEAYAFSQSAVDVNGDLCEKKFTDVDIWLKSLSPQLKQKWTEEDEEMFKSLKTLLDDASCYSCTEGVDKILAWLKQKIGR